MVMELIAPRCAQFQKRELWKETPRLVMKLGHQKDSSPGSATTMPLLRGLPTTGEDGVASMRSLHLAATYYGTLPGQSMKMVLLCVNHISL